MSMSWTVPFSAQTKPGRSWVCRFGAAIERRWKAYCRWRVEQIAIAQLNAMTDRELMDIGLTRSEIDGAVRLGPSARGNETPPTK